LGTEGSGQAGWDGEAERLGGLEVDDELEFGRLLDLQVGRLLALEDASDIVAGLTERIGDVGTIAHQPAHHGLLAMWKAGGNQMAYRQFRDLLAPVVKTWPLLIALGN
jgi:hypothetical protein